MKKIVLLLVAAILVLGGGFAVYQFANPTKRFKKHVAKAHILLRQNDHAGALAEFRAAYDAKGGYTPIASDEVLALEMEARLKNKDLAGAVALAKEYLAKPENANDTKVSLTLARLYLGSRDFESAFALITSMIERDPQNLGARGMLAQIRSQQGRHDLAEQQYRLMAKAYPDSIPVLLALADNLEAQGRMDERFALLKQAVAKSPANPGARLGLVDAWLRQQKPDSAQAVLDNWRKADSSQAYQIALRKASIQTIGAHFDAAGEILKPWLDNKDAHTGAHFEMALLWAKQEKYDSATKIYRYIAHQFPAYAEPAVNSETMLILAQGKPAEALANVQGHDPALEKPENLKLALYAYKALGDDRKAHELVGKSKADANHTREYESFLTQAPGDPAFIGDLALVNYYLVARQPGYALKAGQKLFKAYPKNNLAISLLAEQFRALGAPNLAYEALSKLPKPSHSQRIIMATYLVGTHKDKEATAMLQKDLAENPGAPGTNFMLADCAFRAGKADQALDFYEKELAVDSNNLVVLNNVAWQYGVIKKDAAKAAPYLARLQKRAQSDPRILDTIGWITALGGDLPKAESSLKQAVSLVPDNPTLLYHLAYVEARLGRKDDARDGLQKALASPASWEGKQDAAALLKTL